jgi:ribosome-associated toxin RatA of RatAB toxin-antitoxin module
MRGSIIRRVFVVAIFLLGFAAIASAGPISGKLTPAELAKIKNGEIIVKNNIDTKTDSGTGVAFGVIKGSVEEFWKVIFDHEHYMDFYPRLEGVRVIKRDKKIAVIEFDMDATLKTITYTTAATVSDDRMRMDWVLDATRPHKYFKKNGGYWQLEKLDDNTLLVEYSVDVALDFGPFSSVATKVVNSMAKDDLPDVIVCTRERVQSGGTWIRPKK